MNKTAILILTGALALSGCVTTGALYENKSIRDVSSLSEAQSLVRPGMSMAQVEAKLGKPTRRSVINNEETWQYISAKAVIFSAVPEYKSLTVTFNNAGRVKNVSFASQSSS